MAFSDRDIEEVRNRANLAEVVSQYVQLKPAGGRRLKGLCPFHQEKTPSFVVDQDRQLYHCFGCGVGGDVYSFLMDIEKLSFTEAVEQLAARVGYTLTRTHIERAAKNERDRLFAAMEEALAAYRTNLLRSTAARAARDYLAARGFSLSTIEEFELGFAPDAFDVLTKHLLKKGFREDELVKVGLSRRGDRGLYDMFRGRIMFPVRDIRGRVVAFGGRVVGSGEPKYLNSPETVLFKKGSTLYNLHRARRAIVARDRCVIVEGYTDVIALHQAGIEYAVATLGTALTADHLRTLLRFTQNVYLAFDADRAGKAAAERGLDLISAAGNAAVSVVVLPEGLDPADLVVKEGREAFEASLASAVRLEEFCLRERVKRFNLADPKGKAAAVDALAPVFKAITDPVVFEEYVRMAADLLGVGIETLRLKIEPGKMYNYRFARERRVPTVRVDARLEREHELLKTLLQFPDPAVSRARELLEEHELSDPASRAVYAALLDSDETAGAEPDTLLTAIRVRGGEEAVRLASKLLVEEVRCQDPDLIPAHVIELIYFIKDARLAEAARNLRNELKQAERTGDQNRAADLLREIQVLTLARQGLRESLLGPERP